MTHIVQICLDPSILDEQSETFQRHTACAETLAQLAPDSSLTIFVFAKNSLPQKQFRNLSLIPVQGTFETSFFALWRALNDLHRTSKIDLLTTQTVHQDGWFGLLWGKMHRVKVMGQIHYDIFSPLLQRGWKPALRPVYWLRHWISVFLLPYYSALRTVNDKNRRQLLQKHKILVAAIPVAMSVVKENVATDNARDNIVLFVGRLSEEKNLFFWLECARIIADQNPATKFIIAGDGRLRAALEEKAKDLGVPVQFAGFVPHTELADYYAKAKILLMTSYYEGFGRVMAEAMAHGLPVISTPTAGAEDMIAHGENGFIAETKEAIGQAAERLLNDDRVFQSFSEKARLSVQDRFSFDRLKEKWARFLLDTAQGGLYKES